MWLLLLFVILPAVELYLLVTVGGYIGPIATVGIIVITGMTGWSLVKLQGLVTLRRIRSEVALGKLPAEEMVAGLCLLGAGLLLVTPGFLTDTVGFAVLIPPLRRALARHLLGRFATKIGASSFMRGGGVGRGEAEGEPVDLGEGEVIDIPAEHVKTYGSGGRPDGADDFRRRSD